MKQQVLKQNTLFRTAYYRGKSKADPLLVVFVRKNKEGVTRVGITTGKKAGNAVKRSRCRRVIRAAWRAVAPQVKTGYDVVLVARAKTAFVKSWQVQVSLAQLLAELGVICE